MRVFHGIYLRVLAVALIGCLAIFLAAPAVGVPSQRTLGLAVLVLASIVVGSETIPVWLGQRQARRADGLRRGKHYDEAVVAYDEWMRRYGGDRGFPAGVAWALANKGRTLVDLHRPADALPLFEEVISKDSEDAPPALRVIISLAMLYRAATLGELGRTDEELAGYAEIVDRFGASWEAALRDAVAQALSCKGFTLKRLGRTEEAIDAVDEVVRRYGDAPRYALRVRVASALTQKAIWLKELDHPADALTVCDDIDSRFGGAKEPVLREAAGQALMYKAALLARMGRKPDSIGVYDVLVARFESTKEPALRSLVGSALVSKAIALDRLGGNPDEAETNYRRAIEVDPDSFNLDAYADFLTTVRHDVSGADGYYLRAIAADPRNACRLDSYAMFLQHVRRDVDAAETYYRRSIEAEPKHGTHFDNYAAFLRSVRNDTDGAQSLYIQAEACYKRSIEAEPFEAVWVGSYGGSLLAQGRTQEGLTLLSQVKRMAPDPGVTLAAAFYEFAHDPDLERRRLGRETVERLLADGVRSEGWCFDGNVEEAKRSGHSEPEYLEALARVVAHDADISELTAPQPDTAARPSRLMGHDTTA